MGTVEVFCDGLTMQNIYDKAIFDAQTAADNAVKAGTTTSSTTPPANYSTNGGGRDNLGLPLDAKTFAREYVKFSSATFIHSRSVFADANCTGQMISRTAESGTYKLGAVGADATYPISSSFAATMATLFAPPAVGYANGHPHRGRRWIQRLGARYCQRHYQLHLPEKRYRRQWRANTGQSPRW